MEKEEKEKEHRPALANFERRENPRFSIDLLAEYSPIGNSKSIPGRVGDISKGGVMLYLPEEVEVGQNLRVKIFLATGLELKFIEAVTQVVWKDFHFGTKDDYHRTGVKFVDISPEDMGKLKNFLIILNTLEPI
jgi:c-di-GMP-binding flagellar brake protein YcgR